MVKLIQTEKITIKGENVFDAQENGEVGVAKLEEKPPPQIQLGKATATNMIGTEKAVLHILTSLWF